MTQTQAAAPTSAPPQLIRPDVYQLTGEGITVTYHPVGPGGVPTLTYQDHHRSVGFRGADVRRAEVPDLGTVVSVTLVMTVDSGSITFSVLLPDVSLPDHLGASATISTEGITTIHRFLLAPALNQGQHELYSVKPMSGTASNVIIPL